MDKKDQEQFDQAKGVALSSSFHVVRQSAVATLLRLDKDGALKVLLQVFQNPDEDSSFRAFAATELGKSGKAEFVSALCAMMEEQLVREIEAKAQGRGAVGAEHIRGKTAEALGMLADSRAALPLLKSLEMDYNLQQSKTVSRSPWAMGHMEDALEKVLLRNGVEYLRDSLDELHGLLQSKNPKVRETSAYLAGSLADMRSLDPLLSALEKESAASGESRFADRLLQALGSVCDRCEGVQGLRLYEKKVGKALGRLMKDDGVEVQAGLKALESRAKKKRRENSKLKDMFSTAEAVLVFDSMVRATRQGMRKGMMRLRRAQR